MKRATIILIVIIASTELLDREASTTILPTKEEVSNDWGLLTLALIIVESEGNPLAVGSANDVGVLQITPIYVEDVNRILGVEMYSLADRTDIEASIEMFNIYQAHYNQELDIEKAIKLHNPRAGVEYLNKVLNEYNLLKN